MAGWTSTTRRFLVVGSPAVRDLLDRPIGNVIPAFDRSTLEAVDGLSCRLKDAPLAFAP